MADGGKAPRFRRLGREARRASLVEAGIRCLARGGLPAFTVDRVCREAGASRGLVAHHFGSMEGLLAAVYVAMYDRMLGVAAPAGDPEPGLDAILDAVLSDALVDEGTLHAWLALWGAVAGSRPLREAHRRHYDHYAARLRAALSREAARRGRAVDEEALARSLIALVDGLWLQRCLDPARLSGAEARALCRALLAASLGP